MSHGHSESAEQTLMEYITKAVQAAVAEEYDKAIEEATYEARAKRDEVVATIALKLSSNMSIQTLSNELRITIDKSKLESK